MKNFDSDINNAVGKATIIESKKATRTRETVAKTSTAKLSFANETAEERTFIGEGKKRGLMR